MKRSTPASLTSLTVGICSLLCGADAALCSAQENQARSVRAGAITRSMVIRIYDVSDMLQDPPLLGDFMKGDTNATSVRAGGGFGGMGAGGMGGGGMMRIPDDILPQMAGGGGGGGGMGMGGMGMGMGGGFAMMTNASPYSSQLTAAVILNLIVTHISGNPAGQSDPNGDSTIQWASVDGQGGTISSVGSLLVVKQFPEVHERIAEFLKILRASVRADPTVQVDVRIVEIAPDESTDGPNVADQSSEPDKSPSELAALENAARLTIRCGNRRIAKIAAGVRRSFVVGITPVVGNQVISGVVPGGNSIGYKPETVTPLLGLFGRVKPDVDREGTTGRIHLGVVLASGPQEVLSATFGPDSSTIDRVEISTAELDTAVTADANTWTLAGVVTLSSSEEAITSGDPLTHLAVVMRWHAVD